jgi:hypothetical protein
VSGIWHDSSCRYITIGDHQRPSVNNPFSLLRDDNTTCVRLRTMIVINLMVITRHLTIPPEGYELCLLCVFLRISAPEPADHSELYNTGRRGKHFSTYIPQFKLHRLRPPQISQRNPAYRGNFNACNTIQMTRTYYLQLEYKIQCGHFKRLLCNISR